MKMRRIIHPDFIQIDEIQILSYDGPMRNRKRLDPSLGLLVRIVSTTHADRIIGLGEARVSPRKRDESWAQLRELAASLEGKTVGWRNNPSKAIQSTVPANRRDESYPVRALKRALEHIGSQLGALPDHHFETLREQWDTEEWPLIISQQETGSSRVADLDWQRLFPRVTDFAVFPEAPEPYPADFNTYTEQRMPGAPKGIRFQSELEMAALSSGVKTRRFSDNFFLAQQANNDVAVGFGKLNSSAVSVASIVATQNKIAGKRLLRKLDLPVPKGFHVAAEANDEAEGKIDTIGFPLVVKPAYGEKGFGVTTGVSTLEDFRDAFKRASEAGFVPNDVLVEEEIPGNDFRIFATEEKVLSVIKREGAHVIGNGQHSIGELITWASAIRKKNPHLARLGFIPDLVPDVLSEQGLDLSSVPPEGTKVRLARSDSLSQGGNSTSVLARTHPSILRVAVAAVRAFGLPYAGVDIILEDHESSIYEQKSSIIEVNTSPEMGSQKYPMYGQGIDIQLELFRLTAQNAGLSLPEPADELTVKATIFGEFQMFEYRERIQLAAVELGISGWVATLGWRDEVEVVAHGPTLRVANLLSMAYSGMGRSSPVEIQTEPIDEIPDHGFHVISKKTFNGGE